MELAKSEKEFIENYFGLTFENKKGRVLLAGNLKFSAIYDFQKREYKILDPSKEYAHANFIKDSYDIEIDLENKNIYRSVKETSEKIKSNVKKLNLNEIQDLHVQEDGRVCVAGYFDERDDISLKDFIIEVLIPFFYDQSYYAKKKIWPRNDYSHGYLGILENYYIKIKYLNPIKDAQKIRELSRRCIYFFADVVKDQKFLQYLSGALLDKSLIQKIASEKKCICRIGNDDNMFYYDCHSDAHRGFLYLAENVVRFRLKKHVLKVGHYK